MMFEPSEITVSDYLNQWYELSCKPNLKYNTRLGHSSIQTALQTYVHDTEKMGTQSVQLFEQITSVEPL